MSDTYDREVLRDTPQVMRIWIVAEEDTQETKIISVHLAEATANAEAERLGGGWLGFFVYDYEVLP